MIGGMRKARISRKLKQPTSTPMASATSKPSRTMESWVSMTLVATAPASVIVAGIDRSTLPGPSVITNIWPRPTIT